MTNPICHVDIPLADTETGTEFYRKVFGWEIDTSFPGYPMFKAEGGPGGGFVAKGDGPMQMQSVRIFMLTNDINATLEQIEANGGQTVMPRTEIEGGHGAFAVFNDPSGTTLALYQAPAQQ